jgi:hypothetical protein
LTDCDVPQGAPENIRFLKSSREEIGKLAEKSLDMKVSLSSNRKLCDLRPAYGVIFDDYIKSYDFWGYCDIDVIWGDIRSFYNENILKNYDVVSARKNRMAGHFSLLRNTPEINLAFRAHPQLEEIMKTTAYCWFDERGFSDLIASKAKENGLRVLWDKYRVNFVNHVDKYPSVLSWLDRFRWDNGKLYSKADQGSEIMYLHFMNWKNTLNWCSISNSKNISSFNISFSHISTQGHYPNLRYRISSLIYTFKKPKYFLIYFYRNFFRAVNKISNRSHFINH